MKTIKKLFWGSSLLLIFFLCGGCATRYFSDAYPHQPWSGKNCKAEARITEISSIEGPTIPWLEWKGNGWGYTDSRKVTQKCEAYLKQKGLWVEPKPISAPSDPRYPWGILNPEQYVYHTLDYDRKRAGYDNIATIVCIKPTVVVSVPGIIEYRLVVYKNYNKDGVYEFPTFQYYQFAFPPPGQKLAYEHLSPRYIILDSGYAYGTRMPYTPTPEWFSPDMNIPPRPVEMLSKDKGQISVPWGRLILNRENDEWVITTESK
ncbi:MAG TPA: hypothetical protein DDW84_02440 [Phycisphaerales bacterium]|nr:MAG: hypothetical protein A2Y13_04190 [Planctomycetes bacterium GWC2_45_44]HAL45882.1 hypothetical protein [Phycisphaerales bacterium]HBG77696.1 hypothetical protein [Phycisphaerales bacterium]HBR20442.1 hypothetical protein [Phycisphaerales bacterium]